MIMANLNDKELYPEYKYPEIDFENPAKNNTAEFREPIARLGKKITDRIPQKLGLKKITMEDPEYWGLNAMIDTDEKAELAYLLDVRKPVTIDQIFELVKNCKVESLKAKSKEEKKAT